MPDDALEARVRQFEQCWRPDQPCRIAHLIAQAETLPISEQHRLLIELISIDLEFRWRTWANAPRSTAPHTLEDYFTRFIDLLSLEQPPINLIGEEYRARRLWGDRPSHAEFLARFHAPRKELAHELNRIDRELEEESSHTPLPHSSHRASPTPFPVHHDSRVLLAEYRDYALRTMIGAGRTGKVYRAWQPSACRNVAVKFLRKSFLNQQPIVERFLSEARTISSLSHPNIVAPHGLGRTPGGSYFIVMDLVDGPNLEVVARSRNVSIAESIAWTIELCHALEHAHGKGIIHCDLKPANLLLDASGKLRVTDFGLSRSLGEQRPGIDAIEGTAPFMAPEQAARCWGTIDQRTDVYGAGAVLFTLLTGRPPWVGRGVPDILADVISARPAVAPHTLRADLPTPLSDICARSLSKQPSARFPNIRDLRERLAAL